ncbi:MAG: PAS domain-containing protein, partial [Planctomycetota bacterium]
MIIPQSSILDAILDTIADGVFTVDLEFRITGFNRAAEEITGINRKDAVGRRCAEIFEAGICEKVCFLKKALDKEKPVRNQAAHFVNRNGDRIPLRISAALLRDENGGIVGGVETFRDMRLDDARPLEPLVNLPYAS